MKKIVIIGLLWSSAMLYSQENNDPEVIKDSLKITYLDEIILIENPLKNISHSVIAID